ncbi:phosphate ABC transporter ATP-binding protein PstB [Brochothrix thermosphacta]|uniref:phosphate ABC transporter ATP-binding protein PstB n=1 Tax=Brochothrix thermosphacta TaxID=2756 RepID=UPI00083F983F|nr:phosphate ABC transporter ATP-binding protein [Brochothrix thermosphacta]ODJ69926.1 phosphate ABC transporter ATP-binding protein [Brochothrix thermosphacta]
MSEFAIETKKLNVHYGDKHAIKDVSLAFPKNQVIALIGPSGCGKSTYLRSLNRMNDEIEGCRSEGPILYHGRDVNTAAEDLYELRKNIGMVFQKPNPFTKSIYKNITFALKRHGIKEKHVLEERVEKSLKAAALWEEVKDTLNKSALSLSGGQQQRLCIARTVATEPDILLLDEPASALDPISTSKIENLITQLKEHYTIIIVTHNMQQASRISDKTAFFYLGEVIEYNDTATIFTNPSHERTQAYVSGNFG